MDKRRNINQYRERLDRTLASPKLTDAKSLKSLVKTQMLQSSLKENEGCSETVIEKRTAEVSNFLDMLRSVSDVGTEGSKTHDSASSHPDWKLKQDNEEFRVMYREGPQGSPFHSLLVEGYVNGPLDVCLCISWETALYRKWWPQSTIPTFKILSCNCLQKVRIGEQISLVRVKVSWPLSTREAIVHYFLFEYLEDDLLVVILNTVSDTGSIDTSTHGFTNEAIPDAKDVVRIDVVGGFAIQKVTSERSYFRTIASMDIKLDFVPPSLINFISRQLIGNGFRLYQKAVASMFTGDDEFNKALKDTLYTRIRETLCSTKKLNGSLEEEETLEVAVEEEEQLKSELADLSEERITSNLDYSKVTDQNSNSNHHTVELPVQVTDSTASCEIVELKSEESKHFDDEILVEQMTERSPVHGKRKIVISSDVEQALGTLEKVISMVREYGFNTKTPSWFTSERSPKENDPDKDSKSVEEDAGVCSNVEVIVESGKEATERTPSQDVGNGPAIQNSRQGSSNSFRKEGNHNRIAPASPEHKMSVSCDDTNQVVLSSANTDPPVVAIMNHNTATQNDKHRSSDTNGIHKSSLNKVKKPGKQKSYRLCCIG